MHRVTVLPYYHAILSLRNDANISSPLIVECPGTPALFFISCMNGGVSMGPPPQSSILPIPVETDAAQVYGGNQDFHFFIFPFWLPSGTLCKTNVSGERA